MYLDIEDILRESGRSKGIRVETDPKELNVVADDCEFGQPIVLEAELSNINRIIRLKGRVETAYETFCARCLKPLTQKISVDIDEDIVEVSPSMREDSYTYEGKSVVLDGVVSDAILLRIPIRHLCKENCVI